VRPVNRRYTGRCATPPAPLRPCSARPHPCCRPYCTRLLADLGARVIKIERPIEGDEMRRNPHQIEAGRDDQSTYFARVNAGKESVAVDLSRPEGREVVLGLARHADVFIENFAPGVAGKLGLAYDAVRAAKPDIVYCSISGFGQTGPWRERPAFAHIINAPG
jgi:crotonobetainyl-CoA:carnitine CoA-transferase CaiB-like acyl-CoA transferase